MNMENLIDKTKEATAFLKSKIDKEYAYGIILGSGLGNLTQYIKTHVSIPYGEIPNFPVSTVLGHKGSLIFGELGGKNVVAITIHHHASLPYREYFDDIEDIFIAFGGRPHWGKKHRLGPDRLRHLYPMWEQFHELRRQFDPDGIFLNDYLKKLYIIMAVPPMSEKLR